MADNELVMIVGAGASAEVDFPVGTGLKDKIKQLLKLHDGYDYRVSDDLIHYAISVIASQGYDFNTLYESCEKISNAMPQVRSIDSFIDKHKGNECIEKCGKLAIVRAILNAEKASKLYIDLSNTYNKLNFDRIETTWFNNFWELLTENCQIEGIEKRFSSLVLIIFNYDRCIEHFLYHSLMNVYGIKSTQAAQLVNNIKIYHPYGVVGSLPWQGKSDNISFGGEPSHHDLAKLSGHIKTFTEGTDEGSSEVVAIRSAVLDAKSVLFLGFSFHELNMRLLTSTQTRDHNTPNAVYYGSAMGISPSNLQHIKVEIENLSKRGPPSANLKSVTCAEIISEYSRDLTFSE